MTAPLTEDECRIENGGRHSLDPFCVTHRKSAILCLRASRDEAARLRSIADERGERLVALTEELNLLLQNGHRLSAEAARLREALEKTAYTKDIRGWPICRFCDSRPPARHESPCAAAILDAPPEPKTGETK